MKHLRPPKFNRVQQLLESGSGPGGRRFKSSLPDHQIPLMFYNLRASGVGLGLVKIGAIGAILE